MISRPEPPLPSFPSKGEEKDFRKLWVGQTLSQFGSQIGSTALEFTAILVLNATPLQLGVLNAVSAVPVLLLGLLAGVWVDRLRRRNILIAADLGRALVLMAVPLAAFAGVLRLEVLYVVAAIVAGLAVFFDVAYPSYVPSLVPPESLVQANSRLSASESIAEIAGPGVGGALVQVLSAPFTVAFDAASFVASAISLLTIRAHEPQIHHADTAKDTNAKAVLREAVEGVRLSVTQPVLRALLGQAAFNSVAGGIIGTLYGVYAVRELGMTPLLVGIVVGVGGASALVGAFVAERVVTRFGVGRTLIGTGALGWASTFLIVLANGPLTVTLPLLIASQAADIAGAIFAINALSLRQATTPNHMLGRVNAGMRVMEGVLLPIGALVGGLLAGLVGVRATMAVGICIGALSLAWIVFSPIRQMHRS